MNKKAIKCKYFDLYNKTIEGKVKNCSQTKSIEKNNARKCIQPWFWRLFVKDNEELYFSLYIKDLFWDLKKEVEFEKDISI